MSVPFVCATAARCAYAEKRPVAITECTKRFHAFITLKAPQNPVWRPSRSDQLADWFGRDARKRSAHLAADAHSAWAKGCFGECPVRVPFSRFVGTRSQGSTL